jgi:hypothetical protein
MHTYIQLTFTYIQTHVILSSYQCSGVHNTSESIQHTYIHTYISHLHTYKLTSYLHHTNAQEYMTPQNLYKHTYIHTYIHIAFTYTQTHFILALYQCVHNISGVHNISESESAYSSESYILPSAVSP